MLRTRLSLSEVIIRCDGLVAAHGSAICSRARNLRTYLQILCQVSQFVWQKNLFRPPTLMKPTPRRVLASWGLSEVLMERPVLVYAAGIRKAAAGVEERPAG